MQDILYKKTIGEIQGIVEKEIELAQESNKVDDKEYYSLLGQKHILETITEIVEEENKIAQENN